MRHAPALAAGLMLLTLAGTVALAQPEQPGVNPRVKAQVDRLMVGDANADGSLSREELPGRLADRIFDAADTNADGLLSRPELESYFNAQRGRAAPAAPTAPVMPGREASNEPAASGVVSDEAFEGAMKQAGQAMRTLRRTGFEQATRDSDLDAVQSIQEAMMLAKDTFETVSVAPQAGAKFGDDNGAYKREFRLALIGSIRAALDIEEALLRDDPEAAKQALARLQDNQKQSHNLFQDNG